MGRQYGLQQSTQLENLWTENIAYMLYAEDAETVKSDMADILEHFRVSDSNVYDFLLGVADGAGISGEDAVIAVLCPAFDYEGDWFDYGSSRDIECMTVAAWGDMTEDGHHLGGANLDYESTAAIASLSHVISYPDAGYAVIASGGVTGNSFMNSEGVVISYASGPEVYAAESGEIENLKEVSYEGMFGFWYAASTCATADEAVAMLTQGDWVQFGNINVSDNSGNAYVIEQMDYATVIRRVGEHGETDYLLSANQFQDESWKADYYYEEEDNGPRYATVQKIMQDEAGHVTPATLANGLGSIRYFENGQWSEENWNYEGFDAFHSPECDDGYFKTVIRTIFDATDGEAYILRGHDEKFRSDVPYGTANYIRLVLGEDMYTTNLSAEDDARAAIRNAGAALYQLPEVSNTALEAYNKAAEALHTGANYTHMALYAEVSGDMEQAAILYGLATSQYTAAQRYAHAAYTTENVILEG